MGFFDIFKKCNINKGVQLFKKDPASVLLDVRTQEEYEQKRIEGSKNIPLQNIEQIEEVITDKKTSLYVYCRSGVRSAKAVAILKKMGYAKVVDIGGIIDYKGETIGE